MFLVHVADRQNVAVTAGVQGIVSPLAAATDQGDAGPVVRAGRSGCARRRVRCEGSISFDEPQWQPRRAPQLHWERKERREIWNGLLGSDCFMVLSDRTLRPASRRTIDETRIDDKTGPARRHGPYNFAGRKVFLASGGFVVKLSADSNKKKSMAANHTGNSSAPADSTRSSSARAPTC